MDLLSSSQIYLIHCNAMAKHSTKSILILAFLPLLVLVKADCNSTQTSAATNRFIEIYNLPEPPQLPVQRMFRVEDISNRLTIDTDAETCVNHPFSYRGTLALTTEACDAMTGGTWGTYTTSQIMGRLHSWKAPVLILIFLFPRPPLGIATWIFTLVHLCGDPVDTIASLLALEFIQRDEPDGSLFPHYNVSYAFRLQRILIGKTPNFTTARAIG